MTTWRHMMTLIAAALLYLGAGSPAWAGGEISVHVGESSTVRLGYKFNELAVGNPTVADYLVRENSATGAEILINGKQAGVTNLLIWDGSGKKSDEYTIKVLVRDLAGYMRQLQALVGRVEGVRFRVAGEKVVVEGEAVVPKELERMNRMLGDAPQVVNVATVSPAALKVVAEKIEKSLGDSNVKVQAVDQKIVLRGLVFSEERKKQLEQEARLHYPQVENFLEFQASKLRPGEGDMVQVTGNFMEVSNSIINGWGVDWSPGTSSSIRGSQGLGDGTGFVGAVVGTVSNLFPKFSSAKEVGGARVLETSSVSVRSGENADLQSGGEMGVPVTQPAGGTTIEWKKYGVFLKVLPITQGETISMRIEVEVSAPSGTSPGGFINFKRSQISTVQVCRSGDSVALGGLVSHHDAKVFDKLPTGSSGGSGGTGALFELYASEDFRKQRSQFVVFVTPAILGGGAKTAHQELRNSVGEAFDSYQERKR